MKQTLSIIIYIVKHFMKSVNCAFNILQFRFKNCCSIRKMARWPGPKDIYYLYIFIYYLRIKINK